MKVRSLLLLAITLRLSVLSADGQVTDPPYLNPEAGRWADSVMRNMTYAEKLGQLFMVDAYSNRDSVHVKQLANLIRDYHIGGVIFFQGGPERQAVLNNYLQSLSRIPLMVGIDGEWGLSMRLDSTVRYPRLMTLSAAGSDSLVYRVAADIGKQCRRMGIHINFAPVVDVNNNPSNPVINTRSFGDDPLEVSRRAGLFIKGMQSERVLGCVKHFPGHGDTDADSHLALPVITKSREALEKTELVPFRKTLSEGAGSVMAAHLFVPALDSTPGQASSLSAKVVTGLLKQEFGYHGLVFTDALNMKGVADYYTPGDIALKALLAGNDMLLFSADVPSAYWRIHYGVQNCEIGEEEIDFRVKKILMAKYWAGLNRYMPVDTTGLLEDLNASAYRFRASDAYAKAVTVLHDPDGYLPLRNVAPGTIASVVIGDSLRNPFQQALNRYSRVDCFALPRDFSVASGDSLLRQLAGYSTVVVSIHNIFTKASMRYGISDTVAAFISSLTGKLPAVSVVFGNSYSLVRLQPVMKSRSVIMAYEDTRDPHLAAARLIMGGQGASGLLPVSVSSEFPKGMGTCTSGKPTRLSFTSPESLGIPQEAFAKVDSIAAQVVRSGAAPGGQILVARNGKVIIDKPFGTFAYDSTRMVTSDDLYDLASVTKIAGTALAVMKLVDQKKLDISKKASYYLPELRHTNKKNILISDILTHQAGLQAWIPFWKNTMENGRPAFNIYHHEKDVNYSLKVADSLFMLPSYRDKIWETILASEVQKPGKYVYSDLGMLIMQRIAEKITGESMDQFLKKEFYDPLGLYKLRFNPLEAFSDSVIAPTERDTAFRRQLVRGTVHDPAAAMLGGVAGNAGLFSNAAGLAVVMEMLLENGTYGGKQYLSENTIRLFTAKFHSKGDNRRGLIFDKPEPVSGKEGPTARSASPQTFGHTGFTGTCAWADPVHGLVFIFLSNRVYPDAGNNKLAKGNYRTDIMEEVYRVFRYYGL